MMSNASQMAIPLAGRLRGVVNAQAAGKTMRQGSVTLADQIVASGTTFLTSVMIGRICLKEDFGLYMLGFNVYTFLLTLQASLICTPYSIRYPQTRREDVPELTGNALVQQLSIYGVVSLCVVFAGTAVCLADSSADMGHMLIALGSSVAFMLVRDFARQVAFAQLSSATALALDTAVASGQIAAIGVAGYLGGLNATLAFVLIGIVNAATVAGWFIANRRELRLDVRTAFRDFVTQWQATRWLFLSGFVWCVSMNLYAWLLAGFHGTASTASWGAALGIVAIINPIGLGVQNFLGPRIMHGYAEGGIAKLRSVVRRASAVYGGGLVLFSVSMLLMGDLLVGAIYGAKYQGNGVLVAILAMNLACGAFSFAFSRGLFALNRAVVDFRVNFVALVCLLVFGVWLAKYYGPVGAALGQLATNAAACIVRVIAFSMCTRGDSGEAAA